MQKDISIPMENFAYSKMEHPFKWIFSKHWNWKFLYYYFKICRGPDRTSKRAVVCSSLPYTMGTGSFPGVKRPGRGVGHPTPYSADVKETVELYLYSPSGPSWPVIGWTFTCLNNYFNIITVFNICEGETSWNNFLIYVLMMMVNQIGRNVS